jgi:hypothetical protein
MKFTPPEQAFITRYGPGANFAAIHFYEISPAEQGIAKVLQIRNLLTFTGRSFEWTEYGKALAGSAAA